MVRIRPVRKSVVARKPKPSRARVTSRLRRGWPSGFVRSNTSDPMNPVELGDQPGQIVDADFEAGADVHGLGDRRMFRRQDDAFGAVLDVQELARRVPVPQQTTSLAPVSIASTNFRISAGMTCDDAGSKLSCGP